MSERPIHFSAPMIRALLDGRKTQTRRIMKSQPRIFEIDDNGTPCQVGCMQIEGEAVNRIWLGTERAGVLTSQKVHAVGDRLWAKEAWRTARAYDDLSPSEMSGEEDIWYEADRAGDNAYWPAGPWAGRYRHARYMPRWASRLTLIVTDVRVQRLQDISEEDAAAEGCFKGRTGRVFENFTSMRLGGDQWSCARDWFADVWTSIHGPDSWDANPWVVALTFDVVRKNIDEMEVTG